MPSKSPSIDEALAGKLKALGARIRAQREAQKIAAAVAAEAAGMSRVTWHRIEHGEPSVTMGAYLSAIDALGLQLGLRDAQVRPGPVSRTNHLPERVRLADYPQLQRVAGELQGLEEVSPAEALNLYERHWRHIDRASLEPAEWALVQSLVEQLGGGRLLV